MRSEENLERDSSCSMRRTGGIDEATELDLYMHGLEAKYFIGRFCKIVSQCFYRS